MDWTEDTERSTKMSTITITIDQIIAEARSRTPEQWAEALSTSLEDMLGRGYPGLFGIATKKVGFHVGRIAYDALEPVAEMSPDEIGTEPGFIDE